CYGDEKGSNNTHILSRVKNLSRAVYNCSEAWMNFGNADLILNGRRGSCKQNNYEKRILDSFTQNNYEKEVLIRKKNISTKLVEFVIDEFETFIVKKVTKLTLFSL
ncbi:116_t:CDS:1, partial [Racocetra persica]